MSFDQLPAWAQSHDLIILDPSGKETTRQLDDLNGDGKFDELYFLVSLAPRESIGLQGKIGAKKVSTKSLLKAEVIQDTLHLQSPTHTVQTKDITSLNFYHSSTKLSALTTGYTTPNLLKEETQSRILTQGALRLIVEQKSLWRTKSEALVLTQRISLGLHDPLLRSEIQKVRWPQDGNSAPLAFEVAQKKYAIKAFTTRWLLEDRAAGTPFPRVAILFRASNLQQPLAMFSIKDRWRQVYSNESKRINTAVLIGNTKIAKSNSTDWDRQVENAQQRWLNPMEVIVAR